MLRGAAVSPPRRTYTPSPTPRGKLGGSVGALADEASAISAGGLLKRTEVAVIDKLLVQAITALVGLAIGAVACEAGTAVFSWILN
jgi:hypothetical protein